MAPDFNLRVVREDLVKRAEAHLARTLRSLEQTLAQIEDLDNFINTLPDEVQLTRHELNPEGRFDYYEDLREIQYHLAGVSWAMQVLTNTIEVILRPGWQERTPEELPLIVGR